MRDVCGLRKLKIIQKESFLTGCPLYNKVSNRDY